MTITIHPTNLLDNMADGANEEDTAWMAEHFPQVLPLIIASLEEDGYTVETDDEGGARGTSATFSEDIESDPALYAEASRDFDNATSDRWTEV